MKVRDVIQILQEHSPAEYAEEWDNVGLLAGRTDKPVRKIIVALDALDSVVEQAVMTKADMLITHHPLIFTPLKRVTDGDFIGRRLIHLIQNDISYYAMHTNFDVRGMTELSAKRLGLAGSSVLQTVVTDENGVCEGIGSVGELREVMKLKELAAYVKQSFSLEHVIVCGDLEREINCVAVCTGSGKREVKEAVKAGAQVLVTGDIDYHTAIDADAQGLSLIDAGHFGTEIMFSEFISNYLRERCPGVEVVRAEETNPFVVL